MTTKTILTTLDIFKIAQQHKGDPCVFARAIEQAVLQSPEAQALRKDAERYQAIRNASCDADAVTLNRIITHIKDQHGGDLDSFSYELYDAGVDAAMEKQS